MNLALSPFQSRFAAFALMLFTLATLTAAIAFPTLWLHKRYDTYLEDYSDQLLRYRRVDSLRPRIQEALNDVEKLDARKLYLKSSSPSLAAAELQDLATRIIDAHKGRIVSSQIQSAKDAAKEDSKAKVPLKVTISVQMNTSMVPLQLILHAVESNEPYLFIDQLTIRANQGRGFRAVPGVQPEFGVQMSISGYALTVGGKQ
jgi:general secretion pathway protein M